MSIITRFVLICHVVFLLSSRSVLSEVQRVIISGGGPAGLFAAHALLSRYPLAKQYDVHIIEAKNDPRFAESGPRAYSLGLNIRGQSAFNHFAIKDRFPRLLDLIRDRGVETDAFYLHFGSKKIAIRKPSVKGSVESSGKSIPPTVLIPRNKLCATMLEYLEQLYPTSSNRFRTTFNSRLTDVDLSNRQVKLEDGTIISYDLLIGADGVQSAVREAMARSTISASQPFQYEEVTLPGFFKVMVTPTPPSLEADAVHALSSSSADFGLFCIPSTLNPNLTCALVNWNSKDQDLPNILRPNATVEDVQEGIASAFPQFGRPSSEAVVQLQSQFPSNARTVRCNRYHDSNGRVLLLGDAAHSTGGTLGQGANSALLDVVALDEALEIEKDCIPAALQRFSARQVPEGLSLWKLLQLPSRGLLGVLYQASQVLLRLLGSLPGIKSRENRPRPVQELLSQTLVPFSQIVRRNQFWINLATRKFKNIDYTPE